MCPFVGLHCGCVPPSVNICVSVHWVALWVRHPLVCVPSLEDNLHWILACCLLRFAAFFKQFKLFQMIQTFHTFRQTSNSFTFPYLWLPLLTYVCLCLSLFTFVQMTHLCTNFVLVSRYAVRYISFIPYYQQD